MADILDNVDAELLGRIDRAVSSLGTTRAALVERALDTTSRMLPRSTSGPRPARRLASRSRLAAVKRTLIAAVRTRAAPTPTTARSSSVLSDARCQRAAAVAEW
jgi:hypothetical protein